MTTPQLLPGILAGILACLVAGATPPTSVAALSRPSSSESYKLERMAPDAKVPTEVPEPFAKRLDPRGWKLVGDDAGEEKLLCELWLCAEVPVTPTPTTEMNVKQAKLALGTLVGVLHATGTTSDFRQQPIAAGYYGLRYAWQPSDGNHLGTSDSRDFLAVTSLAHDKDPGPVAKLDDVVALSVPVSPSDHALVLYVATPEEAQGDATKAGEARLFQRAGKEEWAADLPLATRAPGADKSEPIRLAVVLVGHVAE